VKRDTAIFWKSLPNTGVFSRRVDEPAHLLLVPDAIPRDGTGQPNQQEREECLEDVGHQTRILVGAGSSPPSVLNMAAKTGTMNSSMPITARIAMKKTTTDTSSRT
jgi:hypothetical protein